MVTRTPIDPAKVTAAVLGISSAIANIHQTVQGAVSQTAVNISEDAQQRAPVRKIFGKPRRGFRRLGRTAATHKAALARRRAALAKGEPVRPREYTQSARRKFRQFEANLAAKIKVSESQYIEGEYERFGVRSWRRTMPIRELVGRRGESGLPYTGTMSRPSRHMALNLQLRRGVPSQLGFRGRAELRRAQLAGYGTLDQGEADIKAQRTAAIRIGNRVYLGGRLKASIKPTPAIKEGRVFRGYVGTDVYYAKYVEFGTRHAASQPFLRPALKAEQLRYHRKMTLAVNQAIRASRARGVVGGAAAGRIAASQAGEAEATGGSRSIEGGPQGL